MKNLLGTNQNPFVYGFPDLHINRFSVRRKTPVTRNEIFAPEFCVGRSHMGTVGVYMLKKNIDHNKKIEHVCFRVSSTISNILERKY